MQEHNGPTLVVSLDGSAHHRTIGEAVQAAVPGTRILLRPGRYLESVRLDKAVHIVGDGIRDDIVVEGQDAPSFTITTSGVRLSGVSLRSDDKKGALVVFGSAVVEGCAIGFGHGSGVVADAGSRDVHLAIRGCLIHLNAVAGVSVGEGASAVIEDNVISDNNYGIIVCDAEATVLNNRIFDNISGIRLFSFDYEPGEPYRLDDTTVQGNYIYGSLRSGVTAYWGTAPKIVENHIFGNGHHGISTGACAIPSIRGNMIRENDLGGISVLAHEEFDENNVLADYADWPPSAPMIEANIIYANGGPGIQIGGIGARPTVRRNAIHSNDGAGISLASGAAPSIDENQVYSNAKSDIETLADGHPT